MNKKAGMSEFDSSAPFLKSSAQQLSALIASGEERGPLWRPEPPTS
jgi:hypothetical protein